MNRLFVRLVLFVFVVGVVLPALPVLAQETEEAMAEDQRVVEEIVVTARKKEETVQDVPFSVVAPTGEQLRDLGAENIEDISANVAGLNVQNLGPGQSQVAMRGVSAGQIVRDQPGVKEQVGIYLDESVLSLSLFTPDIDLFDMNRFEVLRGPQGTLFGSGSLSGTLRYISNQPQIGVNETIGEFSLGVIDDGGTGGSAKVAVNVPISDTSAMRVAAYYTSYGGFIDAVQPDLSVKKDVNGGDRIGIRWAFLFEPNENLKVTPRVLYQEVNMDGWNRIDAFNILANPYTTTRPAVKLGERQLFSQIDEPTTDEFLLADLNIEYQIGNKTLTSVTSVTDRDILVIRDATALTASITGGSIGLGPEVFEIDAPLYDATKAKGYTQELRLSGGNDRLQWLTGVFYSDADRDYTQNLPVIGFEDTACDVYEVCIPTAGTKLALKDELYKSDLSYKFNQLALFGEMTYSVNDRMDVTAGLRWYDFEEDRVQVFDGIFADPIDSVGSVTADGIAPRVIVSYQLSDDRQLNAQISKGFRLGGINDPLNLPLCTGNDFATYGGHPTWGDEELWNYEVGAKSSVMGGRGTFNASVYYMDIDNLQATVTAGSCSSRIILNVPKARSSGVEAEFVVSPTNDFDFAISGAYTNSELRSSITADDASGTPQIVAGIKSGNRLPTVPEFQMAAAATYHWSTSGGLGGYVTGSFQHVGSRFTQIGDQGAGFGTVVLDSFAGDIGGPYTQSTFTFDPELPAYDIVNLRFGFLLNQWDTALYINNAADERAFLALDQERGTRARVGYLTNTPRTFGVMTRVTF